MSVLPIRLYPDPVLRARTDEVTEFGPELMAFVEDMLETMYDDQGVGLAANQVGVSRRLFVFDCGGGQKGHIVNPVWEPLDEEKQFGSEGCLSVPGIYGEVERYNHVLVRGVTALGEPIEFEATGLFARCIQHETDHLDGNVFLQRLTGDDRKRAMAEVRNSDWFGLSVVPDHYRGRGE